MSTWNVLPFHPVCLARLSSGISSSQTFRVPWRLHEHPSSVLHDTIHTPCRLVPSMNSKPCVHRSELIHLCSLEFNTTGAQHMLGERNWKLYIITPKQRTIFAVYFTVFYKLLPAKMGYHLNIPLFWSSDITCLWVKCVISKILSHQTEAVLKQSSLLRSVSLKPSYWGGWQTAGICLCVWFVAFVEHEIFSVCHRFWKTACVFTAHAEQTATANSKRTTSSFASSCGETLPWLKSKSHHHL